MRAGLPKVNITAPIQGSEEAGREKEEKRFILTFGTRPSHPPVFEQRAEGFLPCLPPWGKGEQCAKGKNFLSEISFSRVLKEKKTTLRRL